MARSKYYIEAQVGDYVKPDGWPVGENLSAGDEFCPFRLKTRNGMYAVDITVTGNPKWNGCLWESRCKINFMGDGEPNNVVGGILYTK